MALKLYIENVEFKPSYKYEDDATPPSGYTETDDPVDWDTAHMSLLGTANLPFNSTFRDKISIAYDAISTPVREQKEIASKWFIIDKVDRDETSRDQQEDAELLISRLIDDNAQSEENSGVTSIVNADTAAINVIAKNIAASWKAPVISLGDGVTSSVTIFRATGGGLQYIFSGSSDGEWSSNIPLTTNGIAYDGSDLQLKPRYELSTTPGSGDTVEFEIEYTFFTAGDDSDAPPTSFTDAIVQTGRAINIAYDDLLPTKLIGVVGKDTLNLSVKRDGTGGGSDTYPGSIWVLALQFEKA